MEENTKKKSFKRVRTACLISLSTILVAFGITWAFYSDSPALANLLQTSNTSISMVEEYNPNTSFLPGETVPKVVSFQNTGNLDLFLRVQVPPEEGWYLSNEGVETKAEALSSARVIKNWSDAWTTKYGTAITWGDNQRIRVKEQNVKNWAGDNGSECEWTDPFPATDKDGNTVYYRYYKKILKGTDNAGNITSGGTTSPILNSITLDPRVSNDRHKTDYSDKIYKLTFHAQAVPVELQGDIVDGKQQLAVQAEWGMTVSGKEDALIWEASGNGQ